MTVATRLKWQRHPVNGLNLQRQTPSTLLKQWMMQVKGWVLTLRGWNSNAHVYTFCQPLAQKTPLQCHKITEMSSYLNSNMPLLFYNCIDVPSGMMLCRFCTCGTSGNILIKYAGCWCRSHRCQLVRHVTDPLLGECQHIYIILHGHVTHLYKQMYVSTAM